MPGPGRAAVAAAAEGAGGVGQPGRRSCCGRSPTRAAAVSRWTVTCAASPTARWPPRRSTSSIASCDLHERRDVRRHRSRQRSRRDPRWRRGCFEDQPVNVDASSTGSPDPQGSVLAAVDGDPGTSWTAATTDDAASAHPELGRPAHGERSAARAWRTTPRARAPTEVALTWPGGRRDGHARTRRRGPVPGRSSTRELTMRVTEAESVGSLGFDSSAVARADRHHRASADRVCRTSRWPSPPTRCASRADPGRRWWSTARRSQTSAETSLAELADGARVRAELCGHRGAWRFAPARNTVDARGLGPPRARGPWS